jgi:aminoglycoside phosphotransferase (APT) family kinase protein
MPALQDWFVKAWTLVEDRIGTGLKAAQRDVVTRFGQWLSDWAATAPEPFTLVHLDYRVDNFLFADDRDLRT